MFVAKSSHVRNPIPPIKISNMIVTLIIIFPEKAVNDENLFSIPIKSNPALQNAEIEWKIEYQIPFAIPNLPINTGDIAIAPNTSILKIIFKIKDVIKYIENNYRNDINITTLANICHYNEYHFMRFFKKYTGKTCIQFIKNYRLEKAYNLLKNTDLPVTQISFDVGFSNVSYFIRSFKEKYKVTPKELRLRVDDSFNV